jgi:lambda family phage minor tail protein L
MSAPTSHLVEGQKLTADAVVDLFEIQLKGTQYPVYVRFTNGPEVTWQGKTYEAMACKFTGHARSADDERSRPKLQVLNPIGLFNSFAMNGNIDGAVVERRRVLRQHLETNVNLSETTLWYVGRIMEIITGQSITLELRALVDGPDQLIPARKYLPPEFPFVTL